VTHLLAAIEAAIPRCRLCPRLVSYCADVARTKRRAFAAEEYWGKPVPGFGDPRARIWILGLAPAAHGANRTGRMFTGDRSGDFLYAALHRAGLACQSDSRSKEDGQALRGVYISAAARCAPPANKPEADELERCAPFLDQEADALGEWRVVLCLGAVGWGAALRLVQRRGVLLGTPRPRFAHGAEFASGDRLLLGSFHVSQQNTFTGRLTPAMFDAVLARAIAFAGLRVRAS
jgi:uracil-DNA glycosylase family 4